MIFRVAVCVFVLAPLLAAAQPSLSDIAALRSKAAVDGYVDVRVTTRAVAAISAAPLTPTATQQTAIQREQQKVLIPLLAKGLVVGSEISIQSDGSFTMRVRPDAIEELSRSPDIAILGASGKSGQGVLQ